MQKLGFIGWRGMVGSVLMSRMIEEGDFNYCDPYFFSTSQKGQMGPEISGKTAHPLLDAYDLDALMGMDIIISCQGGDYTNEIYPKLKESGFKGYFIDAASALRMKDDAVIILDPVNKDLILDRLNQGYKTFVGGNCTVSLMLMGFYGIFKQDLVEWISSATYQAASGAGAKHMRELLVQMGQIYGSVKTDLDNLNTSMLKIEKAVRDTMQSSALTIENFRAPLACNVLPWIDKAMDNGQTREEWKAMAEANKICGYEKAPIPIDGNCVRVGSLRCHSQSIVIKLKKKLSLADVTDLIKSSTKNTLFVDNNYDDTIHKLTPAYISGTLDVAVGRVRKMNLGDDFISAFTVGDQLLWGAAEPLRRMFCLLVNKPLD